MAWNCQTRNGFQLFEVSSAFQKCIRRCLVEDALYWATELYISGYDEYCWKRMKIMVSEDVGLAEPGLAAEIAALYQFYTELKAKRSAKDRPDALQFYHAVMRLAMAKKSRCVDHALVVHLCKHGSLKRPIPDFALDKHTLAGKQKGRGWEHFWREGAKLENEGGPEDVWRDKAIIAIEHGPKPRYDRGRNGCDATDDCTHEPAPDTDPSTLF